MTNNTTGNYLNDSTGHQAYDMYQVIPYYLEPPYLYIPNTLDNNSIPAYITTKDLQISSLELKIDKLVSDLNKLNNNVKELNEKFKSSLPLEDETLIIVSDEVVDGLFQGQSYLISKYSSPNKAAKINSLQSNDYINILLDSLYGALYSVSLTSWPKSKLVIRFYSNFITMDELKKYTNYLTSYINPNDIEDKYINKLNILRENMPNTIEFDLSDSTYIYKGLIK